MKYLSIFRKPSVLRIKQQYVVNLNQVDKNNLKLILKNKFWKVKEIKIIIPPNIIDIYTRLEILLRIKLTGYCDTLTEASNLIDELYRRGEVQNKQQYRNVLNKFST